MSAEPARYRIETLLNSSVQPFDDLTDAELAALGAGMGPGPLADPVSISSDGILLDGHQRLKVRLAQGKRFIPASDVRVIPQANQKNALEWAVRLNVQRRQLSIKEKAEVARKLQRERRWSQRRVADVFGVSQAAVSQWLGQTQGENAIESGDVIGADGKVQSVASKLRRPSTQVKPHPWSERGECLALARKMKGRVDGAAQFEQTLAGLTEVERDVMLTTLQDLEMSIGILIESLKGDSLRRTVLSTPTRGQDIDGLRLCLASPSRVRRVGGRTGPLP